MHPTSYPPGPCGRRRAMTLVAVLAVSMILPACSGQVLAPRVDASRARDTLRTVLDAWKGGGTIAALKSGSPPIVVQDFDWMGGASLVDYEVTGEGKDDDANLRIPVALTLRLPEGREVRKNVSYVVGTSPALTVFRDFQ